MMLSGSIALWFLLLFQGQPVPYLGEDVFTPGEKANLARATSLDSRIKIYHAASKRIYKTLWETARHENPEAVPGILNKLSSLLSNSLEDIAENSKSKKKSKKLIKFEIQVRKTINDLLDLKLKAPSDQQDAYDACINQAENVRKKFVDILFRP